jgi:hypothetical protein
MNYEEYIALNPLMKNTVDEKFYRIYIHDSARITWKIRERVHTYEDRYAPGWQVRNEEQRRGLVQAIKQRDLEAFMRHVPKRGYNVLIYEESVYDEEEEEEIDVSWVTAYDMITDDLLQGYTYMTSATIETLFAMLEYISLPVM